MPLKKTTAKKTAAKKPVVKKEKDWKKVALAELKKYENDKGLKIASYGNEDDEFVAESSSAEYRVFKSYNDAEKEAVRYVEEMIEEMPENFNQGFMNNYYYVSDTDKRIIAGEEADRTLEDEGLEEGDEGYQERYDKIYNTWYKGLDKDPVDFLINDQGIYSDVSEISFLGIDSRKAAQEAVDVDGVAHFLSSYDGNQIEMTNGAVAYRTN